MSAASSLAAPWAVEVGVITVRDLTAVHRPPLPSELLASFVVFGALAGVSLAAPKAAVAAGWGLVVATVLSSKVDFLKPVGEFMAGKPVARPVDPATVNRNTVGSTDLNTVINPPPR